MSKYSLILASKSPRRHELLNWLKIPFKIEVANIEEKILKGMSPTKVVKNIAKMKGQHVYDKLSKKNNFGKTYFPCVVSADTIVVLNNEIIGKPKTKSDARRILKKLSNSEHIVITGVYIILLDIKNKKVRKKSFSITSKVVFEKIGKDLLENYLSSGEPMDKAGAYGIQGQALTFVSSIKGSYSNIVGFPLTDFIRELKKIINYGDDLSNEWRKSFK